MSDKKINKVEELDLEAAIARLDEIAQKLSAGEISLEDSLALYEEGVALVRHCNAKLDAVERKITVLKAGEDGEITEQPFDAAQIR